MTHTESEILMQPTLWTQALHLARARAEEIGAMLKGSVVLVGAGSSYYVSLACAAYLHERLGIAASASPASVYRPQRQETAVFISRSGTTTEIVEAAAAARDAGVVSVVITCEPESPLSQLGKTVVSLDFVQERSIVQTGSATSTIVLLRAIADLLGGHPRNTRLVDQLEQALQDPIPLPPELRHLVVLGSLWRYGVACEAALKAQEMAQMWTERYVPLEYRHGPISCADERTLVAILDDEDPRIRSLADDIRTTGASVHLAGYDPVVELVRLQRVALDRALERGLDPDRPTHLTRSVIL